MNFDMLTSIIRKCLLSQVIECSNLFTLRDGLNLFSMKDKDNLANAKLLRNQ